jgi:hypothetical protein
MPRAPKHDIVIYRNGTFELDLTYQDSDGCAIDLSSGYTCQIEGRETLDGSSKFEFESDNNTSNVILSGATPNIKIKMSASDTGAITAGTGVYDVKLIHSGSTVFLIEGEYEAVEPVSRTAIS